MSSANACNSQPASTYEFQQWVVMMAFTSAELRARREQRRQAKLKKLHADVAQLRYQLACAQSKPLMATLSETTQAEFDRIVEEQLRMLRARYAKEVDAAVKVKVNKQVALERQHYIEKVNETELLLQRLWRHQETLSQHMTLNEFKLALGNVHPDLQLENERAGEAKSFQIFRQARSRLEPAKPMRRGRSW